uniref:Transmembrane protein 252 n=1 Tax=Dromaius novaehollandiae TaxID=8790 RepID=A0A8C4JJV9_DRONO|nr:transmembrane protein 252 [Dromaius novaehollandiae]
MPKGVLSFIRLFVLLLSFCAICLGAFCLSTSTLLCKCGNKQLAVYCLLPLGFLLLVTGICWNAFHEAIKYKGLSNIFNRNPSLRELHVSTIDRPDFYPPSYEDSTDPEKQTFPLPFASMLKDEEVSRLPPPLYTESSTEFISETGGQEEPPPYELSVQEPRQQQTDEQDSAAERVSSTHAPTQENSC